jgi:hypothetical protein
MVEICQNSCDLQRFDTSLIKNINKGALVMGSSASERIKEQVSRAWEKASPYAKKAVHWGFIPTIIVVGMTCTDPKPSLAQVLGPM